MVTLQSSMGICLIIHILQRLSAPPLLSLWLLTIPSTSKVPSLYIFQSDKVTIGIVLLQLLFGSCWHLNEKPPPCILNQWWWELSPCV